MLFMVEDSILGLSELAVIMLERWVRFSARTAILYLVITSLYMSWWTVNLCIFHLCTGPLRQCYKLISKIVLWQYWI